MTDSEFEKLYSAHFSRVYRYALKLCRDENDAEELTSSVFFKALRGMDSFRGESDVFSYLCKIAKNTFISDIRRKKPCEELSENLVAADDLLGRLEDAETAMELHRQLHSLEEPYKEVFTLRVFGELSFAQIAGIFGKTENWACVTFHRARKKLIALNAGGNTYENKL